MRALPLIFLIAFAAACVDPEPQDGPPPTPSPSPSPSPSPTPTPCGPDTCDGCCDATGACQEGITGSACGAGGQTCIECAPDHACTDERRCDTTATVSGDHCDDAVLIPLSGGRATVQGALGAPAYDDSTRSSCSGVGTADRVYRINLPSPGSLRVRVFPAGGLVPVVSLRAVCDTPSSEAVCDAPSASEPREFVIDGLRHGPHFLWVEAASLSSGTFSIELDHTPDAPVPCTGSQLLRLTNGRVTTSGAFTPNSPEVPTCSSAWPGVQYEVEVTEPGTLTATARSRPNKWISVALARDCSGATGLACHDPSSGVAALAEIANVQPGRYALSVAGASVFGGNGHEFDLTVTLDPTPTNHSCAAALPITFTNGRATVRGTTLGAVDDHFSFCLNVMASEGQDVFYRFTLDEPRRFKARATGLSATSEPKLSLRKGACNGAEIDCGVGWQAPSELERGALAAGTYYLVVDSPRAGAGPFELELELGEAAKGESCDSPQPLTFTTGSDGRRTAQVTPEMGQYGREEAVSCNSYNINSTDVVYSFTTTEPLDFHAESIWKSADGVAHLALFRGGCDRASEVKCASEGTASTRTVLDIRSLPAGSYLLVAQSFSSYEIAPLQIDVTLTPPVPGDGCGLPHALAVPADGGHIEVSGDTSAFFNDARGTCGGTGPDALYTFTLTEPTSLRALATTTTSGFTPVLHIKRDAAACPGGEDVACVSGASGRASLERSRLEPGTYLFAVDAASAKGGAYTLSLDFAPAAAGDSCEAPLPLVFTGGHATVTGTTTGLFDDSTSCNGSRNPDRVYSFTTDRELNLTASLATTGRRTRASLSLRTGCEGSTAEACGGLDWDKPSELKVGSLQPGTYFLVADSAETYDLSGYDYELTASLTPPPPGDTCATAIPIEFTGRQASIRGDTSALFHQKQGCNLAGPDAVYTFTTDREFDLLALLARGGIGSPFDGRLTLATSCAVRSDCYSAPSATFIERGALQPGTYFLIVDSPDAARAGPFTLDVELREPRVGESCELPAPLVFPAGETSVTVSADNSTAFDHVPDGACGDTQPGRDLVWSFTTTRTLNLRAVATGPTAYATVPTLSLRPASCATEIACQRAGSGSTVLERTDLPAGTYALVAESSSMTYGHGPFDLTVQLAPPAPGDQCANAHELPFGPDGGIQTIAGDTRDYFDDLQGTCTPGSRAHDTVYAFTTTAPMNLRVRARPTGPTPWLPTTYLMRGDCKSAPLYCDSATSSYRVSEEDVAALPAGRYFLVVDGQSTTAQGPFELDVSLLPVLPGESCANPQPLAFTGGVATEQGHIERWFPDFQPKCDTFTEGRGEDAVYSLTTTQPRFLRASLTSVGAGYQPMLLLKKGTCTGETTACSRGFSQSTVEIAEMVPAGTHYLVVDGTVARNQGAYTLTAELGDQPAGDLCTNALPVAFSRGAAGGTATVRGDVRGFTDDGLLASCADAGSRDVAYTFTTDRTLTLTVTSSSPNLNFRPALALKSGCGGADLGCMRTDLNGHGTLRVADPPLPAGTYTLLVDGVGKTNGDFKLELKLE